MAFSNYSNLFKSGLLSEDSAPAHYTQPWSTEYLGPRRGSLPGSVESTPQPPPSSLGPETAAASIASGESFYFTFKKRRNPSMYRSFLSLDLAESQSLRSASLRAKDSFDGLSSRAGFSYLQTVPYSSFAAIYSPPPPSSPPQSPKSLHSVPDLERSPNPFGLAISPKSPKFSRSRTPFSHSPSPRPYQISFHPLKRQLSPMRFASPPQSPALAAHFDAPSPTMTTFSRSAVLSRTSTVSTGYRRAQRGDALKRLEGRGADGAVGRIRPRVSQNFMSMSDDEDEDEDEEMLEQADIDLIIDSVIEEDDSWDKISEHSSINALKTRSRPSSTLGLTISIDNPAMYNATPRASTWGMVFGDSMDADEEDDIEKGVAIDAPPRVSPPRSSSNSYTSRNSKRTKHSNSPRMSPEAAPPLPLPKVEASPHLRMPAHLHPLSHQSSSSSSLSRSNFSRNKKSPSRSKSNPSSRPTTRPSSGSNIGMRSPSLQSRPPARLELRLDWLPSPNPSEGPNFIDLRDETLDTDSRSDSWRSIFEVSCTA